jgi:signal recognition particle subunit SRP54
MFEALTDRLEAAVKKLRGLGKISEKNVQEAVQEVRLALLEADVHFQVVGELTEAIRAKALGQDVLLSLTPEQQFIKIVNEELVRLMGGSAAGFNVPGRQPHILMLVGLNGSGKTTTAAKLAYYLRQEKHKHSLLVPADVYRPAAIEQLRTLAGMVGEDVYPTSESDRPVEICSKAVEGARSDRKDVVILDTAGRFHVDEELMDELAEIKNRVHPHQILLVVDSMTGQDAVNVAKGFHDRLKLDGVILTKMEGDARGGAALSVRHVTGCPIFFMGVGEKIDALEPFHPERVASRILGMGDVLSLIEKAEKSLDQKQAEKLREKISKNEFTLEDFKDQLVAIRKMGSVDDLVGMIPGFKKMARGFDSDLAEKETRKIEAILNSMTKQEKQNHAIINGSRRKRIALGSGTTVTDVNRFLKQYLEARKMMKQMTKLGKRGLGSMFGQNFFRGL